MNARQVFIPSILATLLFFLYFQLVFWQDAYLGRLLFCIFLLSIGYLLQLVLKKYFLGDKHDLARGVLGCFAGFVLLGFVSSWFVVFYQLNSTLIWWSYVLTGSIAYFVFLASTRAKAKKAYFADRVTDNSAVLFHPWSLIIFLYFALWLVAFCLLFYSRSAEALYSPWQTVSEYYLPIFFVLTFLLGISLFSKFKTKGLLLLIILHSFLLHAYLPLSHQLPWGGDVWRHQAVEETLLAGNAVPPVLFGPEARWREVLGVDLPEALLIPHKYTYGNFWGTSVILSRSLNIDLLTVNKWLLPVLWSLVLPVLLFYLGRILFKSRRQGLWLAGFSTVPFAWQALGALTLPSSFGFLIFLFTLILWLRYLHTEGRVQRNIAMALSVLMLFGYTLYFVLIWAFILSSYLAKTIARSKIPVMQIAQKVVFFFCVMFIIPATELLTKHSHLPVDFSFVDSLKQMAGQFSGWFFATQIRPHDILSGNIFFNHTPDYAFVSSLFTDWRWFVIPVMLYLWIFVLAGLVKAKKVVWSTMALLFGTVLGGYLIGWFVLEGDRLFTRRLDAVLVFVISIFFLYGIKYGSLIMDHGSKKAKKGVLLMLIFVFSWFGATTYASGPDMQVASLDQYDAARYIWGEEDVERGNYCVLGDTWLLLILEGVSSGKIVGGGFPIDYQFGQADRVELFQSIAIEPSDDILIRSHEKTGSMRCWLVLQESKISESVVSYFGPEKIKKIGNIFVMREGLKNENE